MKKIQKVTLIPLVPLTLFIAVYSFGFFVSWLTGHIGWLGYLAVWFIFPVTGFIGVFLPLLDQAMAGPGTLVFQIWCIWMLVTSVFVLSSILRF